MPASIWNAHNIARLGCAAAVVALLSACTSTESTLDPNAVKAQQPAQDAQPATPAATTAPAAAAAAQPTSLQLGGMVGAPSQAVQFLTARMQQQGPAQNLTIVPAGQTAAYAIRGLVSTSPDAGKTVIDFTWELTDSSGAAVHRASGRRAAAGQGEGWQAVTQADMESIADEILAGVSSWLATRQ